MPRAKYFRTNQARNKQMRDLSKSTSMIFSTQETSSDEPLISKETPLEFPEDVHRWRACGSRQKK